MFGPIGWFRRNVCPQSALVAVALALGAAPLAAQTGTLQVTVVDPAGEAVSAALVSVDGVEAPSVATSAVGTVTLTLPAGEQTVRVTRIGFRTASESVVVAAGETRTLRITLPLSPFELGGINVSVLRPDLRPELEVEERQIREANPHDVGGVLRTLPGLDAVRRGGLGLDPVVRGLRDTQVGAYVDGMRTLPGGPGGMDTPLSHVDPTAVRGLEVVKGPYALTWGAGNMSAVRIETNPLPQRGAPPAAARLLLGYDSNLSAAETGLEVAGAGDPLAYTVSGAWREATGYESGAGIEVPGAFTSSEVRGRIGWFAGPSSTLTLSGWLQNQDDIDYPGRPLNADYFDAINGSLRWEQAFTGGAVQSLDAMAYVYTVDHEMTNDGKPTALPNPDRMPPFPMDIVTGSNVEMLGGRVATELAPAGDWIVEVGGDGYTARHEAASTMRNRDTGMVMMERLIWGDAALSNVGLFARAAHPIGRLSASGTVRVDFVSADADSASAFFLENASSTLESTETNLSGALTLTLPVTAAWSVSAGVGSVVRSADANERFSDRSPSKKAQIGAEFMGDPGIRPERSTQVDLWVEAAYRRWTASLNLFAQRIDNHITIEATDLPRQSAMSAPTVYRYVNGDARYRGAEATATVALPADLQLSAATAYVYGEDVTLDEPVLGASPWKGSLGLRWEPPTDGRFMEVVGHAVDRQDRVSTTRGEIVTAGYGSVDLQAGIPLPRGAFLRAGVTNLFDREIVNHLNARNPFTGIPVAEPGRVLFARLSLEF